MVSLIEELQVREAAARAPWRPVSPNLGIGLVVRILR